MPVLDNQRHEVFCHNIVKGMSATDAYTNAGYKKSRQCASALLSKQDIQERIKELKEASASRVEITKSAVIELMQDIIEEAREAGQYGPAMTGAIKFGIECGMFETKSKVTISNPKNMSDDELAAFVAGK